ncbi:MAG TPA: ATP-grasp domain-containing protein [Ktedonobacteraceae bacterium]
MVSGVLDAEDASSVRPSVSVRGYDVLVLDASLRQALVSARALGQQGLSVVALDTDKQAPTFASRWCQKSFISSVPAGSEAYLTFLEHALEQTRARVVIPSADGTVALLRRYRTRLEQRVNVALAGEEALAVAVNKEQTLDIAQRLGLKVPQGIVVRSTAEVREALKDVGLPAVVKPVESWLWNRGQQGERLASLLVTTPEEARQAVEALTASGGSTLFQKFLSGRREAISLLYARGNVYACFAQWAKRTEPPLGGQSVWRQSIAIPPDIGKQAEQLVREIDLDGYSEVEFRRDHVGVPYLMEINPRLSASVEVAVRSGVDFPCLLYRWACGERLEKIEHYQTGVWMRYLKGDIMTTIEALQQRGRPGVTPPVQAILDFWLAFFVPAGYDYFDWRDCMPAIKASADFTRSWVGGAVIKRLLRLKRRFS